MAPCDSDADEYEYSDHQPGARVGIFLHLFAAGRTAGRITRDRSEPIKRARHLVRPLRYGARQFRTVLWAGVQAQTLVGLLRPDQHRVGGEERGVEPLPCHCGRRIDAVTPQALKDVFNKYFPADRSTVVTLIPTPTQG